MGFLDWLKDPFGLAKIARGVDKFRDPARLVKHGSKVVTNANKATTIVKVAIKKPKTSVKAVKGIKNVKKASKSAKVLKNTKVLTGIGAVDIVGDLLVDSDVDRAAGGIFSFLPGMGLIQLGAAALNGIFKTNLLGAKFAWKK